MILNLYCFLSTVGNKLKADRKGVAALEYALMAALIAVVIVSAVTALGGKISNTFANITNAI